MGKEQEMNSKEEEGDARIPCGIQDKKNESFI